MTPKEARSGLTQAEVQRLFGYDPETGIVTRRFTRGRHDRWKAGERVGNARTFGYGAKYRVIGVGTGRQFLEHRIIWLYMTGAWPSDFVDHINRDGCDNRWCNLRAATHQENLQNTKAHCDNLAGIKGVSPFRDMWAVRVKRPDGSRFSKLFPTKEAAAHAYEEEARRVFGEFARVA